VTVALRIGGEEGRAERLDGERLHVVSPRAFAPGSPVSLVVVLGGGEVPLEGRSQGAKRREDGSFDVHVRLINLRRTDRERLAAAL